MKRFFLLLSLLVCSVANAQTDINTQTKGQLQIDRLFHGSANLCLQMDNAGAHVVWAACTAGSTGYTTIQNAAAAITQRSIINWTANIFCTDNAGATRSDCNLATDVSTGTFNATTGFRYQGGAGAGKVLIGDGTNFVPGDPLVQGIHADSSTAVDNPVIVGGYDTAGTPAIHRSTFINGNPAGTEYGIVTRNIPSGTQAVSVSSLPLPSGASQEHTTAGSPSSVRLTDGSAFYKSTTPSDTQPISAASLPLPSGAAQDATLTGGTAKDIIRGGQKGTTNTNADITHTASGANHEVIDVGIYDGLGNQIGTSSNPVRTDPTGTTTQPISASSLPLPTGAAQDSTLTGGTTKAINRGGAKGTTSAADVTSTASGANHQALDVGIYDGAGNQLGTSGSPVRTDPTGTTAQPASQNGTWTVQPGNTANTTPWLFNGGKTNNNAAPGATNDGVLPAVANAAPPSYTEGNQVAVSMDLKGNLRVYGHPPDVLGCYMVNGRTSTYTGLTNGTPLFSYRWGDATRLAVVQRVRVAVATTVASNANSGQAERELIIARSFTASDTGGTAVTLTGNNQKMRTSQGTSLVTDMRFGTTITAGTRTLDANPIASAVAWLGVNFTGIDIGCGGGAAATAAAWTCAGGMGFVDLLNATNGQTYPLVLAQNEGFIIRVGKDTMPSGFTQQTYVEVSWCEVNAY